MDEVKGEVDADNLPVGYGGRNGGVAMEGGGMVDWISRRIAAFPALPDDL